MDFIDYTEQLSIIHQSLVVLQVMLGAFLVYFIIFRGRR